MKLENLTLKELLTLRECVKIIYSKYYNNSIINNNDDKNKCVKLFNILENVTNEIEKKIFEYD